MPSEDTDAAFRLLGPFELRVGDRVVQVRSPKHRIVFDQQKIHGAIIWQVSRVIGLSSLFITNF